LLGYVKVEITGEYVELILNRLVQNNISIWMIKRIDEETISCNLYLKDIRQARVLLRRTGCRMYFKDKKGLPFLLNKIRTRTGFVIGFLFFIIVFFFLSNLIFDIKIDGAS